MEKRVRLLSRNFLIGTLWLAFAIMAMGGAFVYLLDRLTDSRVDTAETFCRSSNRDRQALVDYAQRSVDSQKESPLYPALPKEVRDYIEGESAKQVSDLADSLPLVKDCRKFAEDLVGGGTTPTPTPTRTP